MKKTSVSVEKEIVTELEQIFRIVDDKPYFELKYKKVGENYYHVGYSSFDFHNVLKWKEEYFELVKENVTPVHERDLVGGEIIGSETNVHDENC